MAGAYRACSEHVPATYRTYDAHIHTAYILVTWRLQTGCITGTEAATCETIRLFSRRYDTMHAPTISPRALNCTSMSLPNRTELSLRTCVRPVRAGVCVRGVRGRADRLGVAERLENRRRLDDALAHRAADRTGCGACRAYPWVTCERAARRMPCSARSHSLRRARRVRHTRVTADKAQCYQADGVRGGSRARAGADSIIACGTDGTHGHAGTDAAAHPSRTTRWRWRRDTRA